MRSRVLGVAALLGLAGLAAAQAAAPGAPAAAVAPGVPGAAPGGGARQGGAGNAAAARGPSLALALELAQQALAACQAQKLSVAAVVLDSGGFVKVSLMDDNARSMTPVLGARKGRAALEFRSDSSALAARAAAGEEALRARLAANPELLAASGAVLLQAGNDVLGALAVSGARAEQDEACARQAVERLQDRLKQPG